MRKVFKPSGYRLLITMLACLLLVGSYNLMVPTVAFAAPQDSVEITGDGVTNPVTFTRAQLEGMQQIQQVYSAVNTWPTKKWYVGRGVNLRDLLSLAGIKKDARLIKFTSKDGYTVTLTVKELLNDNRYYFPHLKDNSATDDDGNILSSPADAILVDPIIALVAVEGSNNPAYMSDRDTLLPMIGQRAVTEQTGNIFVKYLNRIEVLSINPPQWDSPQANPGSGEVPAGTMVALSNDHMDDDKVYYTTDGSTPNLNSPMYNQIAKRWWSSRADVLGLYNHPIGPIDKGMTIKAITIGPGKADSDVVTFSYRVSETVKEEPPKNESLKDITSHWAQKNIEQLVSSGAVAGYPDGTFRPDKTITRAEFAAILVKAFKFENQGSKTFADTETHWAKDYIARAAANGVVNGYDVNTFHPDDLITREQVAVMISKAAKLAPVGEKIQFADSDCISAWAREAIATANKNGVMKGYLDNTIRPQGNATRAEAVTTIVSALNK